VKFGFVAKHRGIWPVDVVCEALARAWGNLQHEPIWQCLG